MKLAIFTITALFTLSAYATEPMLQATPYKVVKEALGKGEPHFVELGSDMCHSCQIMGKMLYKMKKKYPTFKIEFINVREERVAAKLFKIQMIPTQLILNATGKEVYRHIGVLESEEIEKLLRRYNF